MKSDGTIFLVDDDDDLRQATARLLRANGYRVKEFADAAKFLEAYDAQAAGCILLDLRMPGMSGLEMQEQLAQRGAPPPIVFLTGHADVPTSVYAMKHGAIDFLQKPVRETELIAALDRALSIDTSTRGDRHELAALEARYATLTPREREVFLELVSGQRNKQAAFALGITERTVKFHRAKVLEKMKAESPVELGRMAELLHIRPAQG
ncbi:MAG: response regulator transcription factor [Planctomycetes bacterium]|nr:response regulator transcription factor [Planctomycetota bacterium]